MHDMRDLETGGMPSPIDVWYRMHYNPEKDWVGDESRRIYEDMIELQFQATPEGQISPIDDEIHERVLGQRCGYVRGLGAGMVPASLKAMPSWRRPHRESSRSGYAHNSGRIVSSK